MVIVMSWYPADVAPKGEKGCWSKDVVAVTNLGHVFKLAYFNGETDGCWQRPGAFAKGEYVERWTDMPEGDFRDKNSKRLAPWPDFVGKQIFEGDTLVHPAGDRGVVVFLEEHTLPGDQWRVRYTDGTLSRLALQINDKGQAVVKN